MQTEKSQPKGKWIMPETRVRQFCSNRVLENGKVTLNKFSECYVRKVLLLLLCCHFLHKYSGYSDGGSVEAWCWSSPQWNIAHFERGGRNVIPERPSKGGYLTELLKDRRPELTHFILNELFCHIYLKSPFSI